MGWRVPVSGPYAGVCLGVPAHTGVFPPTRFEGNFAAALSASGALLALGEMVCVLRCEDILLGSSLMKKREVLRVDSRLKKPNLPRGCFQKDSMFASLIFKQPPPPMDSVDCFDE